MSTSLNTSLHIFVTIPEPCIQIFNKVIGMSCIQIHVLDRALLFISLPHVCVFYLPSSECIRFVPSPNFQPFSVQMKQTDFHVLTNYKGNPLSTSWYISPTLVQVSDHTSPIFKKILECEVEKLKPFHFDYFLDITQTSWTEPYKSIQFPSKIFFHTLNYKMSLIHPSVTFDFHPGLSECKVDFGCSSIAARCIARNHIGKIIPCLSSRIESKQHINNSLPFTSTTIATSTSTTTKIKDDQKQDLSGKQVEETKIESKTNMTMTSYERSVVGRTLKIKFLTMFGKMYRFQGNSRSMNIVQVCVHPKYSPFLLYPISNSKSFFVQCLDSVI